MRQTITRVSNRSFKDLAASMRTVAGRLGHAEGSTTLRFYAQVARPADQHASAVLSGHLAELRKKDAPGA